jgi:anti-sigma-K factor RskA
MASNELDRKTPASREFYWNQIQRQIQRQETLDAPRVAPALIPSLLARWRRIIVPVAGAALGAALLVVSVKQATPTPEFVETTDTSSDFDAMTYHDQHSGMTVVWLKFREQEPAPADAAPDIFDVR